MKTFKHKQLGRLAIEEKIIMWEWKNKMYGIKKIDSRQTFYTYPELIENSSDREEVVEKDWIDDAFDMFWWFAYYETPDSSKDFFRRSVEKHAPKQKKFTRNEVRERISREVKLRTNIDYTTMLLDREVMLCDFLKEHGLLLSDE